MGSSILSEVDDTSILRTGLSICYWRPLGRLPASRLRPPRSGLERSDFVPWPIATNFTLGRDVSFRGEAEVGRTAEPAASVENDPFETLAGYSGPRLNSHPPFGCARLSHCVGMS